MGVFFCSVLVSFCRSSFGEYGGKEMGEPWFDSYVVGDRIWFKGGKMGCCPRGQRQAAYGGIGNTRIHTPAMLKMTPEQGRIRQATVVER